MLSATVRVSTESLRRDLIAQIERASRYPVRVRLPFRGCPLRWLRSQETDTRVYWAGRDNGSVYAAAGFAWQYRVTAGADLEDVVQRCRSALPAGLGMKCFGGLAFRNDQRVGDSQWSQFGAGRFLIPRAVVHSDYLDILLLSPHDLEHALTFCDAAYQQSDVPPTPLPAYRSRQDKPNYAQWEAAVRVALQEFDEEVLEKIVLARRAIFEFVEPLDPLLFLERLNASTTSCYRFCFQFGKSAFLGATPERLFRRSGNQLLSEVVAGTRTRGQSDCEDKRLAEHLLCSVKDQLEHDIVRKSIRQRLYHYVDDLKVDEQASILRLARKQHLISQVEGRLKPGISDGQLLERLHPTPAVGGYPTENALREIDRLEGFDRGWYAAPIGWISEEEAEFAVGIRSGLVQDNRLSLFSGAGIVPGSTPDAEWQEIEHKIGDFLEIMRRSR